MARFRFHSAALLVSVFLFLGLAGGVLAASPQATATPERDRVLPVPLSGLRIVPGLEEPLVATGPTTAQEDAALEAAIAHFRTPATPPDDFADHARPFSDFLVAHPRSAWRLAVLTNLGLGYYRAGYFTRATAAWEEAWAAGRDAGTPQAKALADRAVGELARMHARIGRAEALETLFADLGDRAVSGPATEMITGAQEGLWMFRNEPGTSYLCGPMALKNLLITREADPAAISTVDAARSGPRGFSLEQVAQLAEQVGLRHRLVYRTPDQPVPVPSIVNWKVNHYAAIVGEEGGRYHIQDPTFASGDLWVTTAAIDAESSGYFLVPVEDGHADTPWRTATAEEARRVYGMGFTSVSQPDSTTPNDENLKDTDCGIGMCTANAKTMLVSLQLNDTPLGYQPPKGPSARIRLTYNQREANQPAVFSFFNVGPKWTLNVLSWVQDNPTLPGRSVLRYVAGGGSIDYARGYSYNATTGAFSPERQGQAILVRIPATGAATSYELRLPDGSKQVFAQPDGATVASRRMFLTQIIDPAGNTLSFSYDAQLRLTAITDATGRETMFSYGAANPLLVTRITDPFGRSADLAYDESGRLAAITDVLGLTSSFTYDAGGLINAMTTPYGTSTFAYGSGSNNSRFLEITDPLGFTERLEFRHQAPGIPGSDPVAPAGLGIQNIFLFYRNSFYWDKHVYPITHTDYTQARITHWLHNAAGQTSPIVESTKLPLERREWRTYPGQGATYFEGSAGTPKAVARVLDDGSTQARTFTYNAIGKPLTATDPLGRKTVFTYDPSGIDLLTVQQQTAANGALSTIAAFTYNSQHLPLTYTDAAGQTTAFTYNAAGQILTATNALGETTAYEYDALGYATRIINANGATAASFTYDGFGRVATRTDSEGHTVAFAYDALDRLTKAIFPDGTTYAYTWDKLDLATVTDRLGRVTTFTFDADRRLTAIIDPLGRTTQYSYHENGVLKSLTDPNGNITQWDIDLQSRPIAKRFADGTTETYTYEATTSRLEAIQDAQGQLRQYGYATDDRLLALDYSGALNPTPSVRFAYDAVFPRVTSMSDGNGTTQYQYGPVGSPGALLLAREDGPFQNDVIAYSYDALGRIVSRSVGGSVETFAYDALDRLIGSTNDLGPLTYDYLGETGQLVRRQLGTAIASTWTYDSNANDRRLASIAHSGATRGYELTTDPENIIAGITETAGAGSAFPPRTWDYSYDDADRLLGAQGIGGSVETFAYGYDAADNLTRIDTPAATRSLAYNDVNQIATLNGQPFSYDASGNLTDDGIRTYKWDAENRLVEIGYKAQPSRQTAFRYDGFGRRTAIVETSGIGGTETRYLWCGDMLCQGRAANDAVSRRYFAEGEVWPAAATKLYYAQDQLGSVRDVLVAQMGSRAAAYDYEPYGKPSRSAGRISVDFRYAGMFYHQASGLYLANYRAYDPVTARWLSRDPIEEAGGPNLYGYVVGSPVNYTDRKGLAADILLDAGFILYDLFQLATDPCNREENLTALGLDIIGAVIPGATGLGAGFKAANRAADTAQAAGKTLRAGEQVAKQGTMPAIKAGAAGGETAGKNFPEGIREAAKAENPQKICVYCRQDGVATQVDHAIPKARGGNATLENAQLACPHCNASKGARDFPVNPPPGYRGEWPPSHWNK